MKLKIFQLENTVKCNETFNNLVHVVIINHDIALSISPYIGTINVSYTSPVFLPIYKISLQKSLRAWKRFLNERGYRWRVWGQNIFGRVALLSSTSVIADKRDHLRATARESIDYALPSLAAFHVSRAFILFFFLFYRFSFSPFHLVRCINVVTPSRFACVRVFAALGNALTINRFRWIIKFALNDCTSSVAGKIVVPGLFNFLRSTDELGVEVLRGE